MHIKKTYTTKEMAWWTRFETMLFFLIIAVWVAVYYFFELSWLKIPWTPLALIGTAVAFVIGFQNNAAYGRIWEARKIWGGIVNTSRTFGAFVQDMVNNNYAKDTVGDAELQQEIKVLTYRHIAWMNALRHAMRMPKPWETTVNHKTNQEWDMRPPEQDSSLENDLKPYISESDYNYVMSKNNKQTAMLYLQSHHLQELKEKGLIWEFSFLELEGVIQELFTLQGKSERIKNFPYPRHFATLNHFFMWIFVLLLPMALVPQFASIGNEVANINPIVGELFIWLSIPFYVIVAWVFHTMERIGRTGENPFEGTANDVPISTISRGIEIDLRQNLGESQDEIPKQFAVKHDTQF
ncbi:bestrophin family ion channel [Tamlana sp. 2201CG12-4]|uniref:bestrophin family protein n=1 Tax=Tamlana sp. 2201CG12-4 TaxID=3112582 RepID=UPI002DB8B5AC|nr:bestrophin family ion channel [Tamlana sp. 2201CG12-4]MEC3905637.1 bestrophin family ion channel [Tamlana sp. 2201CG12-4]